MAQFIQKFANRRDYEASEHQYPNVSLIEDEGLVYTMESPEPDVLLNANKIKWNVTDGSTEKTSEDTPSISFDDAQTLIRALNNPEGYIVTATASYNDGVKYNFTDVECSFDNITEQNAEIWIADYGIKIVTLGLFNNSRVAAYNAVRVNVERSDKPRATWEINYTIENAR